MKGREGKGAASASADLLVCFPSRAHLSLMPKSICSPARPSEHSNRHRHPYHHPHHRRNKSTHASPLMWTKNSKQLTRTRGGADDNDNEEPTSPKVTCAGQIKVRPTRSSACRNWQSVMEEIERIHNHANQKKKKTTWADSLGFKKDILQFLTCLRSIRFDFRCFGSFPHQDIIASDEEEEEEEDEYETQVVEATAGREGSESEASTAVFSKWFMVLQENKVRNCEDRTMEEEPAVPPPNALLLMRCRSAPAQTRLQQSQEEEEEEEAAAAKVDEKAAQQVADEDHHHQQQKNKKKKRESLAMVMKYDTDFNKLSPDIAKETWVVMDPFLRSRSWKRW